MADTRTARIELNEQGVVSARIYDGAQQSLADAKEHGNTYLRVAKPGIPTRLVSDETEAAAWLNGHRT
jgi:hypothetical protein